MNGFLFYCFPVIFENITGTFKKYLGLLVVVHTIDFHMNITEICI